MYHVRTLMDVITSFLQSIYEKEIRAILLKIMTADDLLWVPLFKL